ncbi:MAG TPA: hypothetical protein VGP76_14650 [Planctomycetaceae bacterium]|jgi:hypothetical protein|nr:hypothetical protein [Planctomycetaceae bacterium]
MQVSSIENGHGLEKLAAVAKLPDPQPIPLQFFASNLRPFAIPQAWEQHPLVANQWFYTIPERLLTLILREVGDDRFDPQLVQMETELSRLVGDHAVYVGLRRGALIAYELLESPGPLKIRYEDVKDLGWGQSEARIRQFAQIETEQLPALGDPIRGYCGWLMTNPAFVAEHDQLLERYQNQLRQHDFPMPILMSTGQPLPQCPSNEVWVDAFRRFASRWRLQSLVGPGLPRPLPVGLPLMPAVVRNLAAAEGGATIFLTDVNPVPPRSILAEVVEGGASRREESAHLAEWYRIVGQHNPAKNAISHYARLLGVQHYWRIIHARHPAAVKRRAGRLRSAFADYYKVGTDTIRGDLKLITERLGRGWEKRPNSRA